MDRFKKLDALTNTKNQAGLSQRLPESKMSSPKSNPSRIQPQQNNHNPSDSGSDSDEYITSGGAIAKNKDITYTTLGTYLLCCLTWHPANLRHALEEMFETRLLTLSIAGDGVDEPPQQFVTYQLQQGQLTAEGEKFIPWAAVKKYPYTYVGVANRQRVAEGFFDQGKIANEPWDL